MNRCKLTVFTLLLVVATSLITAPMAFAWDPPKPGLDFMNVMVDKALLDNHKLAAGDQIGVFTPDGVLAGLGVVQNPDEVLGFAVYADDPIVAGRQGFFANEALTFKIKAIADGRELTMDVTWGDGPAIYRDDTVLRVKLAAGIGAPNIVLSALDRDFGAVKIGANATWILKLTNTGRADLKISSVAIDNAVFAHDFGANAVVIAAGQSKDVNVIFTPVNAIDYAGKMTVTSDDADEGGLIVNLTGTGSAVTPPSITFSTVSRGFGQVVVNTQSEWTLRVGNVGDQDLTITSVDIPAGAPYTSDFGAQAKVVRTNGMLGVKFTFAPVGDGTFPIDVVINIGLGAANPKIRLRGEGIVVLNPNLALANVGVQNGAYSLFMGNVVAGQSFTHNILIKNAANAQGDLVVSGISIGDAVADVYSVAIPVTGLRIRPGDTFKVPVTFAPKGIRFYPGTMTIHSNHPAGRDVDVNVTLGGLGGDPEGLDFGYFRYGTTETTHNILVTDAKLDGNMLVPGDEVGVFMPSGICAGAGTIRREGQGIRATVTAWGDIAANDYVDGFLVDQAIVFKIYSAETKLEVVAQATFDQGQQVFTLNGDTQLKLAATSPGNTPTVKVTPAELPFGQVLVAGSIGTKNLIISNIGTKTLTVDSLVSDRPVFTTNFKAGTINVGASMDVVVSYDPTEERSRLGRLTLYSDDPLDPVVYIDLSGEGVAVVDLQKLTLSAANFNYNMRVKGSTNDYALTLANTGSASVIVNSVTVNGDQVFSVDWSNRTIIGAGDVKVLKIKYAPVAEGIFSAAISIRWNDPKDVNLNGELVFKVYGKSKDFTTRWAAVPTPLVQYMRVIALVKEGQAAEAPLTYKGSEIGVFTGGGFCAGMAVIGDDANVKFEVYGDNVATPETDGFKPGEKITFKIWDKQRWLEMPGTVEIIGGTDRFTAGKTTDARLHAVAPDAPKLALEAANFFFGTVQLNKASKPNSVKVTNVGDAAITIIGVESSLPNIFKSDFNGQPVVLQPNGFTNIGVTFTPNAKDIFIGTIAVISDMGVAIHRPKGLGGEGAHWPIYTTETAHQILMTNVKYGAEKMSVGDEIAVVRPNGQIAGAGVALEEGKIGIAAFGDDILTADITEGFKDAEAISFRFFDKSSGKEYLQDVAQGLPAPALQWTNNAFTPLEGEISIPGVFTVVNPGPQFKDEGQAVVFDLKVSGALAGAAISMSYMAEEALPGGVPAIVYDANAKVGRCTWQTDLNSSGIHTVGIHTMSISGQDTTKEHISVIVNITNVNQAPAVIRNNLPIDLRDDDILTMSKNQAPIVLNPFNWFVDPDGDAVMIDREADNADLLRHDIDYENNKFTITPIFNQIGSTVFTFRANDLVDRAPGFDGLRKRTARTIGEINPNENLVGPRRDLITEYKFTVKLIDGKRPVVVQDGIPLQIIKEDADSVLVGDLDNFVADPGGGQLTFTALDVSDHIRVLITGATNELRITSAIKDFWSTDTLWFTIKAKSDKDLTAFTTVRVLINSVNDTPEAFALLTPEKRAHVSNDLPTVDFTWEPSIQNQWEIGTITYKLYCYLGMDLVNFIEVPIPPEAGSKWSVDRLEFITMLQGILTEEKTFTWWVKAFDSEGLNVSSTETFTFVIPNISVNSEYSSIPTKLTFDGNYPNPFNGLTTIKYGVPTNGTVDVTVWDISGRRIATLAQGRVSAGWHTAAWNANSLPTGIYFIRVATGNEQIMKKALLVK